MTVIQLAKGQEGHSICKKCFIIKYSNSQQKQAQAKQMTE